MRFELIKKSSPGPAEEPISLEEAKTQLRLGASFTADDDWIQNTGIPDARDRAEGICNRFFTSIEAKIVVFCSFPGASMPIVFPYPNTESINKIGYFDSDNADQEVSASDYAFDADSRFIYMNGSGWPTDAQNFYIEFTSGAPVQFSGAKQAMLMMLSDAYDNRNESVVGTIVSENPAVEAKIYPYRFNLGL